MAHNNQIKSVLNGAVITIKPTVRDVEKISKERKKNPPTVSSCNSLPQKPFIIIPSLLPRRLLTNWLKVR